MRETNFMNNDKHELWLERVNDFKSSGLTCKSWGMSTRLTGGKYLKRDEFIASC